MNLPAGQTPTRRALLYWAAGASAALFASPSARAETSSPTLLVKAKRKPADAWKEYPTRTLAHLPGFKPSATPPELNRFGGWKAKWPAASPGFFRTVFSSGRWWMVDPDGCLMLQTGVVSVSPRRTASGQETLRKRFGSEEGWARQTVALLRRYGFNCTGNWTSDDLLRKSAEPDSLPYCPKLDLMGAFGRSRKMVHQQPGHLGYPNDCFPVFHPDFEPFAFEEAARGAAPRRQDPYVLGYFSDNELPAPADLLDRHLKLDPSDPNLAPGYRAARLWLDDRKSKTADLSDLTADDRDAFRGHVYDRYFAITTRAIRKADPNHLCFGPRLHGGSLRSPSIFSAAGRYLDVIAVNVYGQWSPAPDLLAMWKRESARPFVVTEFYAKGDDSGFANTTGAGWLVPTQADRAWFYQNFTLALLESKHCCGWHWFKYQDNDPDDTSTDPSNRDSNKGIVKNSFEPYGELLDRMAPLNRNVYGLTEYFDRGAGG